MPKPFFGLGAARLMLQLVSAFRQITTFKLYNGIRRSVFDLQKTAELFIRERLTLHENLLALEFVFISDRYVADRQTAALDSSFELLLDSGVDWQN